MVSAARKERDAVDRKNDQLRAQLADTEELLVSHQEQLVELKEVLQQMTREREETEAAMSACGPSTPSDRHSKDSMGRIFESLHLMPGSSSLEDMPPCPPTALINLVHPVLRHDISSYKDFCEVLYNVKPSESRPVSRMSGGSLASGSFASIGMGLSTPVQSSSASISSSIFGRRRVESGSTTHSPSGSVGSTLETQQHIIALKETKFFKRVMVEDIEPTLRLDTAPGLSWLARRNVMSAITEGSLVVDPMPSSIRVTIFACALCGESKADEQHARTHRMRTSDSPNAQRYPLCWYCTTRLRSACDFMAFLRTLKEGLWKCESEGDQKHAWEESVKLRERMFWARIGGGVIFSIHNQAFRDSSSVYRRDSVESRRSGMHPRQQTETPPRTPVLDGMLNDTKLDIPKKRNSTNPFLTPQRQGQRIESDDDEDDGGSVIRIITDDSISPLEIPLPQSPVGKENRLPIEAQPKVKQPPCPAIPAGW